MVLKQISSDAREMTQFYGSHNFGGKWQNTITNSSGRKTANPKIYCALREVCKANVFIFHYYIYYQLICTREVSFSSTIIFASIKIHFRSFHCGSVDKEHYSLCEDASLIHSLTQWVKDLALPQVAL